MFDKWLMSAAIAIAWATTGVLLGIVAGTQVNKRLTQESQDTFQWVWFLDALERVEGPKTKEQAAAAIKREGAHGPLQIRQICLDDVNKKYGTTVTLEDVQNSRTMSRWVCVHYLKMYHADKDYERAARTWNGGPQGPDKDSTKGHWLRVKAELFYSLGEDL